MPAPSLAQLKREKTQVKAKLAQARATGDDEALWEGLKQFDRVEEQIDLYPHRLSRWVYEMVSGCEDAADVERELRHNIETLERGRLDALARGDQIGAERAAEGKAGLEERLAELNRRLN